ncbi:MAG: UDP-glucuronic acid decarboxylase family protein [Oligoflexales bacterium]
MILKRVLIAGGAGFLGSHLSARYLDMGWEVLCLDNLQTGRKSNIDELQKHSNFEWVRHDITEPYFAEVDLVLSFACPASPVHYQADPIRTMKTSVLGALHLLELANRCGARIVQASTSEVYGDPLEHPQSESYWGHVNPIGIRSCYDEGKRAAETLFMDYKRTYQTDIRLIRIFNTYGPQMCMDDGRVVSNFIAQALQNKSLTIYGDGSQTRSFCYVSDLVEGIVRIASDDREDATGPWNLGNDMEFSIRELAEEVLKQTGSLSSLQVLPLPSDDPKVRRPDLSKTKRRFDWSPQVSLVEGIAKTVPYFKSLLDTKRGLL